MTEERQWKRPDQVETFRTSDPKEMLHKYLPKHVLKTWKEDFIDEIEELMEKAPDERTRKKFERFLSEMK